MLMLVLLAALLAETQARMAAGCVLGLVLIPLVVADLRHQLLPDSPDPNAVCGRAVGDIHPPLPYPA